ncbi:hypothetical protein I4U23_005517 [Adineta vaga]|nr:hypothetical protein I4U23_005517 [Adineta vaga]
MIWGILEFTLASANPDKNSVDQCDSSVVSFAQETAITQDPFYIIAHMANNRETLDWAVLRGANAIENDF